MRWWHAFRAWLLFAPGQALVPGRLPGRLQRTRRASAAADAVSFADEQWGLYASQSGRWEGVWSTFNDQGIEAMSHTGVWDLQLVMEGEDGDAATHILEVPGPGGGPRTIPVGTYRRGSLGRQTCAGVGMVTGPSLLRSGLMSTELLLRHGACAQRRRSQLSFFWARGSFGSYASRSVAAEARR